MLFVKTGCLVVINDQVLRKISTVLNHREQLNYCLKLKISKDFLLCNKSLWQYQLSIKWKLSLREMENFSTFSIHHCLRYINYVNNHKLISQITFEKFNQQNSTDLFLNYPKFDFEPPSAIYRRPSRKSAAATMQNAPFLPPPLHPLHFTWVREHRVYHALAEREREREREAVK